MKKHKKSKKRLNADQDTGKEEKSGKKLSGSFWMGVFIAVIMVLSVVGFVWKGGNSQEYEYNGFSFILTQDRLWQLNYDSQRMLFHSHPSEIEHLEMAPEASRTLRNTRMVYATSDPEDPFKDAIGSAQYMMKNVFEANGTYFIYAFTEENRYNKSIITCNNATPAVPVIYLRQGNQTEISYDNNCLVLEADSASGMLGLKDRIIYSVLGIME